MCPRSSLPDGIVRTKEDVRIIFFHDEKEVSNPDPTKQMNIKGMDKAEVLFALWLGSKERGMSFLGRFPLTLDYCKKLIGRGETYFDYLAGRVMEGDLSGDNLDLRLYNRDNGEGTGEFAILDYFTDPKNG